MNKELLFSRLFDSAIKDWPEEINFGSLSYYETPDGESGYTIEGLTSFPEAIEKKYLDNPMRIIFEKLHHNIHSFLGHVARDLVKIRMKELRVETIKKDLDIDLKKYLNSLECIDEDIKIISDYFLANES